MLLVRLGFRQALVPCAVLHQALQDTLKKIRGNNENPSKETVPVIGFWQPLHFLATEVL